MSTPLLCTSTKWTHYFLYWQLATGRDCTFVHRCNFQRYWKHNKTFRIQFQRVSWFLSKSHVQKASDQIRHCGLAADSMSFSPSFTVCHLIITVSLSLSRSLKQTRHRPKETCHYFKHRHHSFHDLHLVSAQFQWYLWVICSSLTDCEIGQKLS